MNETSGKCVEKCPKTHFENAKLKRCDPCHKDCYGCSGSGDHLGASGCSRCASGLVKNDVAYSVIKCIERRDVQNCSNDELYMLVPESLRSHPLRGKPVCRKCHNECLGCYENGAKLNSQCKACRNFYSNASSECVKNCSIINEFLEPDTKVSIEYNQSIFTQMNHFFFNRLVGLAIPSVGLAVAGQRVSNAFNAVLISYITRTQNA